MLVRNRLNAGDFIIPIPLGIPVKLQYDSSGILQEARLWKDENNSAGFSFNRVRLSNEVVESFRLKSIVPVTVPIKGGTTYVYGVLLFKDNSSYELGQLPCAILDDLTNMLVNGHDCRFFAFNVESFAATFKGAIPIRKWLSLAHFQVLPGFLAPFNDVSQVTKLINSQCKPILNTDIFMAYVIFNGVNKTIISTDLYQSVVIGPVNRRLNENGAILAKVPTNEGEISVSWSDIVKFNIWKDTLLIFEGNKLIFSKDIGNKSHKNRESIVSCSVCGRDIPIHSGKISKCRDIHCLSRLYPDAVHMLNTLKLPVMSFDDYLRYVRKKDILTLADILELPIYSNMKIEVSLTTLVSAVIPPRYVADRQLIYQFISQCHNSVESFMYYIGNPVKISSDFNFSSSRVRDLQDWLSDGENISEIHSLLSSDSLSIVDTDKYFEADPIFRNTIICITGEFDIGNESDVRGILGSYSAEVVTQFVPNVRYVVVGNKRSGVDGRILSAAKSVGVPVIEESEFFKRFEIDLDCKENLL